MNHGCRDVCYTEKDGIFWPTVLAHFPMSNYTAAKMVKNINESFTKAVVGQGMDLVFNPMTAIEIASEKRR